jgi:hypothetical protein
VRREQMRKTVIGVLAVALAAGATVVAADSTA